VFVVPPQSVSVNVSVNVGQQTVPQVPPVLQQDPAAGVVPPQYAPPPTHVHTAVNVGAPSLPTVTTAAVPQGPYMPPFQMPTSDVLRRTIPKLARRDDLGLGDHVHTAGCLEGGCALLTTALPAKVNTRPLAIFGWLLVAACMWLVQYSFILPLAWLGAVAHSTGAKAAGWFAILLCGLGPFYALFYLCSPAVPRRALTPWGLNPQRDPV
jgi:hypothetical protein